MPAKTADDIRGLEYDWLAVDDDDHVALLSTAGGGHAPAGFLDDTDAHDRAVAALLASQATTRCRFAPVLRADVDNTWRRAAERGLFAFDSDAQGGPYRLVAAPEVPVLASELPEWLRRAPRLRASRVRAPRMRLPTESGGSGCDSRRPARGSANGPTASFACVGCGPAATVALDPL